MTTHPISRAVITGIGSINPFGSGGQAVVVDMLRANATAIGPITGFATEGLSCHLGAEVPESALVRDEEGRRWSRASLIAVTACRHAVAEADLHGPEATQALGLVIGSEFGDLRSTEAFDAGYLRRGVRGLSGMALP